MTRTAPAVLAVLASLLTLAACTSSSGSRSGSSGSGSGSGTVGSPGGLAKPNLIFIVTDDLTQDLLPFMPRVRAMQSQGLTMDRFYANASLGAPARASIYTGEYPHNSGVLTNGGTDGGYAAYTAKGNDQKTLVRGLRKAGYQTYLLGQYLTGYQPTDAPAAGWLRWEVSGDAYSGYKYTLRRNSTTQKFGTAPSDYFTDMLSRRAAFLVSSAKGQSAPLFLQISTFAPHEPAVAAPQDLKVFPTATYPHTPAFDRAPAHPPTWLKFGALTTATRAAIDEQFRSRVRAAQAVDRMVGRIQKSVESAGLTDNTYLVFTSANGYHQGEYRLPAGKRTAYDVDTRVPLIVSGPGIPVDAHATQLGSSVDLAPTFSRLAGATLSVPPDGVSMDAIWYGQSVAGPSAVLIEHKKGTAFTGNPDPTEPAAGDPPDYEAIRTANALYVRYASGEQEYFDTRKDPYELDNLARTKPVPNPLRRGLAALATCRTATKCQAAAKLSA